MGFKYINPFGTKGALLYSPDGSMCALRGRQPGQTHVRAVLRHTVPNKGLPPLLLDLSGAVDRLDKLPQRIRGKRHQGIRISYDLVGFIPEEELLKQETA